MKDDQKQISLLKFLEPALGLLLTVFSFLTTANSKELSPTTKIILYVVFSLVGIGALYLVYRYLKAYLNYDGNADTIGTSKLKKHIKKLIKLAKRNGKVLKRNLRKNANYVEEYEKEVLKCEPRVKTSTNAKNNNSNSEFSKKDYRSIIKVQKSEHNLKSNALKACSSISNCINDVDHILLSNGQYNDRVKLGKYLFNYHVNYFDRIKATVDMLGWTYSLMGKKAKSAQAIKCGIKELEDTANNYKTLTKDNVNEYYSIYLNLQRAYRHLTANPSIRRSSPFKVSQDNLDKAQKALDKLCVSNKGALFTPRQKSEIKRNQIGITFGLVELNYDFARTAIAKNINLNDAQNKLTSAINYLNNLLKDEEQIKQLDPHRYLNIVMIKNKIYFCATYLANNVNCKSGPIASFIKNFKGKENDADQQITNTLKTVNDSLRKSIYVDQAIESFIQQRVIQTYKEVGTIYNLHYMDKLNKGE